MDLGITVKAKTARAHRKVRAARTDFLHKTSTSLIRDHDLIVDRWYPSTKTCSACGYLLTS